MFSSWARSMCLLFLLAVVGTHTSQCPADLHHNCVCTKTSFLYDKVAWHRYFAKGNTVVKVRPAKYLSLPEPGDLLIRTMGGCCMVYPKRLSGRHGINEGVARLVSTQLIPPPPLKCLPREHRLGGDDSWGRRLYFMLATSDLHKFSSKR